MPLEYVNSNTPEIRSRLDMPIFQESLSRSQDRYDTAVAGREAALQEALSRGYLNQQDRDIFEQKARQQFEDVATKYSGDLSAGYDDIKGAITNVRSDPYHHANQRLLEEAKAERDKVSQLGANAFVNRSVQDERLYDAQGELKDPSQFQSEVFDLQNFYKQGALHGQELSQTQFSGVRNLGNGLLEQQYGFSSPEETGQYLSQNPEIIDNILISRGIDPNNQRLRSEVTRGILENSIGKKDLRSDPNFESDASKRKYALDLEKFNWKKEQARLKANSTKTNTNNKSKGSGRSTYGTPTRKRLQEINNPHIQDLYDKNYDLGKARLDLDDQNLQLSHMDDILKPMQGKVTDFNNTMVSIDNPAYNKEYVKQYNEILDKNTKGLEEVEKEILKFPTTKDLSGRLAQLKMERAKYKKALSSPEGALALLDSTYQAKEAFTVDKPFSLNSLGQSGANYVSPTTELSYQDALEMRNNLQESVKSLNEEKLLLTQQVVNQWKEYAGDESKGPDGKELDASSINDWDKRITYFNARDNSDRQVEIEQPKVPDWVAKDFDAVAEKFSLNKENVYIDPYNKTIIDNKGNYVNISTIASNLDDDRKERLNGYIDLMKKVQGGSKNATMNTYFSTDPKGKSDTYLISNRKDYENYNNTGKVGRPEVFEWGYNEESGQLEWKPVTQAIIAGRMINMLVQSRHTDPTKPTKSRDKLVHQ